MTEGPADGHPPTPFGRGRNGPDAGPSRCPSPSIFVERIVAKVWTLWIGIGSSRANVLRRDVACGACAAYAHGIRDACSARSSPSRSCSAWRAWARSLGLAWNRPERPAGRPNRPPWPRRTTIRPNITRAWSPRPARTTGGSPPRRMSSERRPARTGPSMVISVSNRTRNTRTCWISATGSWRPSRSRPSAWTCPSGTGPTRTRWRTVRDTFTAPACPSAGKAPTV